MVEAGPRGTDEPGELTAKCGTVVFRCGSILFMRELVMMRCLSVVRILSAVRLFGVRWQGERYQNWYALLPDAMPLLREITRFFRLQDVSKFSLGQF